jgi:hypothetical protein
MRSGSIATTATSGRVVSSDWRLFPAVARRLMLAARMILATSQLGLPRLSVLSKHMAPGSFGRPIFHNSDIMKKSDRRCDEGTQGFHQGIDQHGRLPCVPPRVSNGGLHGQMLQWRARAGGFGLLPLDAEDELAAAIMAGGGEPLVRGGKPGDLRALVHKNPPKFFLKTYYRRSGPVSR